MSDKCPVRIYTDSHDFHGHACGRPVVEGEIWCKMHLRHQQRRTAREQQWDNAQQEARQREQILDGYGLTGAFVDTDGKVHIRYTQLLAFLEAQR